MRLFGNKFFKRSEEREIMLAIRQAEKLCSGEVRLFVESNCKIATHERALEVFEKLKMHETNGRNAVLIYVAMKDRKFAIFGDEGIHHKLGFSFWTEEAAVLKSFFKEDKIVEGLCQVVLDIGQVLKEHFPFSASDGNQLSDKPVYGD